MSNVAVNKTVSKLSNKNIILNNYLNLYKIIARYLKLGQFR